MAESIARDWLRPSGTCPMNRGSTLRLAAIAILLVVPVTPARGRTTPDQKCQAAKVRAARNEVYGKMGCYATAKTKALPVNSDCLTRVQARVDRALTHADGVCPGTVAAIDATVDDCVAAFVGADPGTGVCAGASARAQNIAANQLLGCAVKEVTKPGGFPACDAQTDARLSAALPGLGGCVAFSTVHPLLHACHDTVAHVVDLCTFLTNWGGNGQFFGLMFVAVDPDGNVFVTDAGARVQKFDNDGAFLLKWGSQGSGNGQFFGSAGVAVDANGNVFVADSFNSRIQKFDGVGTFLAAWGSPGSGDGQFNRPFATAVDANGNVFVSDADNNRIQKFDNDGTFLTAWGSLGNGNGQFNSPGGVAVDTSGNVLVADSFNNRIQKFDGGGTFLTSWGSLGSGNGQFNRPLGVAVDASGNIFVTDSLNGRIQKFDGGGTFLTTRDRVATPESIATDTAGNLFVTDGSSVQKFSCP